MPLHHWNRCDLGKVVARFAHLINVDEATINRTELSMAKARVGCKNEDSIPKELTIVVGNPQRNTAMKVINKIFLPSGPRSTGRVMFEVPKLMAANASPVDKGKVLAVGVNASWSTGQTILVS